MPRYERNSKLNIDGLSGAVRFFFEIEALKNLLRTGWVLRGMPQDKVESVADHVFGVALMADSLASQYAPHLNREKILRMVLVHELGEVYAGDITPRENVSKEEKHRMEREGIEKVLAGLPSKAEYLALWEEFEACETPEACWVTQIDRLEFVFQMVACHHRGNFGPDERFGRNDEAIKDPELRKIFKELLALGKFDFKAS
jgi:putative hydrolases of HD superfamily